MYKNCTLIGTNVHVKFAIGYPEIQNSKRILIAYEGSKYFIESATDLGQITRSPIYVQILAISTASTISPSRLGNESYHLHAITTEHIPYVGKVLSKC
jgi:hypothetical protein